MAKYSVEIETRALEVFKKNTLITTDMLSEIGMTPSIIFNQLMNKGLISRYEDPLYHKRHLYFLTSKKAKAEEEVEKRKKQSLHIKHKQLLNKIQEIERAKSYHFNLVQKYDNELKQLREKQKFLAILISPV